MAAEETKDELLERVSDSLSGELTREQKDELIAELAEWIHACETCGKLAAYVDGASAACKEHIE